MLLIKKMRVVIGFCLLQLHSCAADAKTTFIFAVNSPGSPPYLYVDQNSKEYVGVVVDVLNKLAEQQHIQVEYIDSHRSRTEKLVQTGIADGFLSSSQWLAEPEKYISSQKLIDHKSFVYSPSPFSQTFTLADLNNSRICMRRSYVYPAIDNHPGLNNYTRVDSSNQLSMMNMMVKDRCNYTVMNEFNASRILHSKDFAKLNIHQSPEPFDVTELNIFLRHDLQTVQQALDEVIDLLRQNGSLARSLKFHTAATQ